MEYGWLVVAFNHIDMRHHFYRNVTHPDKSSGAHIPCLLHCFLAWKNHVKRSINCHTTYILTRFLHGIEMLVRNIAWTYHGNTMEYKWCCKENHMEKARRQNGKIGSKKNGIGGTFCHSIPDEMLKRKQASSIFPCNPILL